METPKEVTLGFYLSPAVLSRGITEEKIIALLSSKTNVDGRVFLALTEYLVKYTKTFDEVYFEVTGALNKVFPNGTMKGLIKNIIRKEVDVAVQQYIATESRTKIVDFAYPFEFHSATFVIRKPDYKPEIFGILQTFSWPLWITIFSVLIMMSFIYYVSLKRKYSLDGILLHSLAVLLRQSSLLNFSTVVERLLIYSWVVGAMFICLAYDSVFLSFLALPPMIPIKDVSQLSKAVIKGDYHCIASTLSGFNSLLLASKQEDLRVIGKDIQTNNLSKESVLYGFLHENVSQNLAFVVDTVVVDGLDVGNKFVSEDRFLESMAAMMIRKDFCCKKLIDMFVLRLMASGLYFKYLNDRSFFIRLPFLLKYMKKDTSKRKLTFTDLAPAFIVIITGYIVSFLVFIGEVLISRKRKVLFWKNSRKDE